MSKKFDLTIWGSGKCFTLSQKKVIEGKGVEGVWLCHDPSRKMTGFVGFANDFKGDSNVTHEQIFKAYPEFKDRYLKELIKRT